MAALDVTALARPLSVEEPCGPDLDLDGDPDFMQAVARIEGLMPASYFTRDRDGRQQAFDRTGIDFPAEIKIVTGLLGRSRDLRLLTLFSRLSALNRDLPGLASGVAAVAALLRSHWSDVNPRGEDGDFGLRSAVLQPLDDMAAVILPLQHIPLAESRRYGSVSFRSVMMAEGEVTAPEGSETIDRAGIERVFAESDLDDLRAKRACIATIVEAAGSIYATMVAEASFEEAVQLERLTALAGRIATHIDTVLVARDPAAAVAAALADSGPDPAATTAAATPAISATVPVATLSDAAAALASVAGYLAAFEPSNPAEILVRQTQSLLGKSFVDVLRILMPNQADDAKIGIGADRMIELSFAQLTALGDAPCGSQDGSEESDRGDVAAVIYPVTSRREAADIMQKISTFYRGAEPSSPVPLLLDRAVATLERDFLSILRDVLPGLTRRND